MRNETYKLLIVDDISANIAILSEILDPQYAIVSLTNGAQVVEMTRLEQPDLILLDVMMPGIDGYEVCRRLKADADLARIPVIFLTALNEADSVVKGFDLGAVDYITKPYYPAELLTRIETHIKLKESRELVAKKNRELAELLQILCHDFLTPISFVLGSMELVHENRSLYDTFESDIFKSLKNATDLIELVRTMRKLDDFDQSLALKSINLSQSVSKALTLLQHRLSHKRITLQVSIPEWQTIKAEETSLINSVINNILTNAIKFSHPHSEIHIHSHEEEDAIVLEVTDSGIGMSEVLQRDLFVITRTTSRKGTGGECGTGYGMLLIKKFLDQYGARLTILSRSEQVSPNDHGTTVRIAFQKG